MKDQIYHWAIKILGESHKSFVISYIVAALLLPVLVVVSAISDHLIFELLLTADMYVVGCMAVFASAGQYFLNLPFIGELVQKGVQYEQLKEQLDRLEDKINSDEKQHISRAS